MSGPLTVLMIEDNPGDARLIELALAEQPGDSILLERADRLSEGLARIAAGGIDVVLLDLSLPDSHGLQTFTRAKAEAPNVPIIVLSGLSNEELAVAAVNEGAQDYLVKGRTDGVDLVRAIRYAIERHQAMTHLMDLAIIDELTGLRNRRGFLMLGEHTLRTADRLGTPLTLLYVDVNGMKVINDAFGHQEGNKALVAVASILSSTFRSSDVLARVGGDEFCALLQGSDADAGPNGPIERLGRALEEFNAGSSNFLLSFSVGAQYYDPEKPCSLEELMELADQEMYRQKVGAARRARLLVVDDDPVLRRLAVALFGDEYDLATVATGAEAYESAVRERPDVILLDLRLPDGPGTDVVQRLRGDPRTARVPIIMLTGHGDEAGEVEALQIGVDDYVRKPFDDAVLRTRIEVAIRRAGRR